MSARQQEIECLSYWPRELVGIIASYAELNQDEKIEILLDSSSGTCRIIVIPNTISMFWIHNHTQKRIFLRCRGIDSREITVCEISQMVIYPHKIPSRNLEKFFRAYADTVVGNCYSIQSKFSDAFRQRLAKIE